MSKAQEAFRTISEVALDLDVPKHVLRFWELKFPQIRPMKRGGGRRYYRPEDMVFLRGIQHLLHAEGYTIKGVQKILREQGIEQVKVHGLAANALAESKTVQASKNQQGGKAASQGAGQKAGRAIRQGTSPVSGRVRALPKSLKGPVKSSARSAQNDQLATIAAAIAELKACRQRLASLGLSNTSNAESKAMPQLKSGRSPR